MGDEAKMKLKFVGSPVFGDRYSCSEFSCKAGQVVEITRQKATQLLNDFPLLFKNFDGKADVKSNPKIVRVRYTGSQQTEVDGVGIKTGTELEVSDVRANELIKAGEWVRVELKKQE